MLLVLCETDDWITNSYCDKSCFSIDLGGVDCCQINENPSTILSDLPSNSPYRVLNVRVITPPSQKPSSFHSLSPSLSSYTDPSKAPINKPSRLPSAVPSADNYENSSSYPSVLTSMYPSEEHSVYSSSVPSYIPSVSNQPSPCTVYTDNVTPEMDDN